MQRNRSYEELSMPNDQLVLDPMIYPGLYSPSGFNIMDILVGEPHLPSYYIFLAVKMSLKLPSNDPH